MRYAWSSQHAPGLQLRTDSRSHPLGLPLGFTKLKVAAQVFNMGLAAFEKEFTGTLQGGVRCNLQMLQSCCFDRGFIIVMIMVMVLQMSGHSPRHERPEGSQQLGQHNGCCKDCTLLIAAEAASISCTSAVLRNCPSSHCHCFPPSPTLLLGSILVVAARCSHQVRPHTGSFRDDIPPDGGQGCLHLLHQGHVARHYNIVSSPWLRSPSGFYPDRRANMSTPDQAT